MKALLLALMLMVSNFEITHDVSKSFSDASEYVTKQARQNILFRIANCNYIEKRLDDNTVVLKWNCPWQE